MAKKIPRSIIITTQDIQNILGKSPRTAVRYMARLREIDDKDHGQFITIEEFCAVSGLTWEQVSIFFEKD